jgi:Flp pilus assembly CpaF family ATPase
MNGSETAGGIRSRGRSVLTLERPQEPPMTTRHPEKTDREVTFTVLAPSGAPLAMTARNVFKIEHVLKDAVRQFAERHELEARGDYLLALGGRPLDPKLTLADAGVVDGSTLNLRTPGVPSDG